MAQFLLINGPNLGLLGQREPDVYGATTLEAIEKHLKKLAKERGHQLTCFQSDAEHELLKSIHDAPEELSLIHI